MLRQTWARSSLLASRQGVKAASKTFATSARRQAEVELTIGKAYCRAMFAGLQRLTIHADGKKVSIEGTKQRSNGYWGDLLMYDHSWFCFDSSLREGRRGCS